MEPSVERVVRTTVRWPMRHTMRIGATDRRQVPVPPGGSLSLYVHVPLCTSLCPFCPFHRVPHREWTSRDSFAVLRDELRLYHRAAFAFANLDVGGGTPTCAPGELAETIALARELFGVQQISVETSPMDLRPDVIERLDVDADVRAQVRAELDEPDPRHGGPLSAAVGGSGWAPQA